MKHAAALPKFFPTLQPGSWQFTHQHVFHYPWQLAISLAARKHTVNIHKVMQTPGHTHSRKLEHMQEDTQTHTHAEIHKHTLIEAHSRQFADRLSELCGIYWLLNFYSELNWMTTNRRSARLSYYPLKPVHAERELKGWHPVMKPFVCASKHVIDERSHLE